MRRSVLNRLFLLLVFCTCTMSLHAQKTDSLFHINGNVLLGEIVKLDYGILHFKMDGMGTIKVEQEKIKSLQSKKYFEFTTDHGRYFYGRMDSTNIEGVILIHTGYDSIQIHLYQIVEIYPIRNQFWKRTSGKVDLGFNYTKASNVARFNIDFNFNYRYKKTYFQITTSNIQTINTADSIPSSSKYDIQIAFSRQINGELAWNVFSKGSQNTELGLNLRLQTGGGIIWNIYRSNIMKLSWLNAVAPNLEVSADSSNSNLNVEYMTSLTYELFKHTNPEISVNTSLDVFPSLNILGRYRVDYNLDASVEVFKDFFVGGRFYYNFDSQPVSDAASKSDFGFTTTLGWSFN